MDILIKEKTQLPESYVVVIKLMHGDDDVETTIVTPKFMKFSDQKALESIINTLDKVNKSSQDFYGAIPEFLAWFAGYDEDDFNGEPEDVVAFNDAYQISRGLTVSWDSDVIYGNGDLYASLFDYDVFYYDENGVEHYTKIIR